MANANKFEICDGINFGSQQNTRYLQTCAVESKTMRNCYQKCNIQNEWGTFESKAHLVMLSPVDVLLQQTFLTSHPVNAITKYLATKRSIYLMIDDLKFPEKQSIYIFSKVNNLYKTQT